MLSTHSIANECTCRLRTFAHNTGTPRLLQYCQLYCNRISLVCRALGATAVPIPGQGTVACCLLGAAAHTQNCSSSCPSARDPYLRAPGQAPHVQRPTPNAMRPALRALLMAVDATTLFAVALAARGAGMNEAATCSTKHIGTRTLIVKSVSWNMLFFFVLWIGLECDV